MLGVKEDTPRKRHSVQKQIAHLLIVPARGRTAKEQIAFGIAMGSAHPVKLLNR